MLPLSIKYCGNNKINLRLFFDSTLQICFFIEKQLQNYYKELKELLKSLKSKLEKMNHDEKSSEPLFTLLLAMSPATPPFFKKIKG